MHSLDSKRFCPSKNRVRRRFPRIRNRSINHNPIALKTRIVKLVRSKHPIKYPKRIVFHSICNRLNFSITATSRDDVESVSYIFATASTLLRSNARSLYAWDAGLRGPIHAAPRAHSDANEDFCFYFESLANTRCF